MQRARTRRALLSAAIELIAEGVPPSIPLAAERALMSPATAYRYFPSAQTLWDEATFEGALAWDNDAIDAAGDDVGDRLDAVVTGLGWLMLDDELPFRMRVKTSLDRWFDQVSDDDNERLPVREGRRRDQLERVVKPLRGELPDNDVDQIKNALALTWGPDAVLVLRDVCLLDTPTAKTTMLQAARWMLAGALATHDPKPTTD